MSEPMSLTTEDQKLLERALMASTEHVYDIAPAPTGMPSEEDVARVLFERGRDVHDARTWEEANVDMREWLKGHAAAILDLFAPILAEKERRDAAEAKQAEFEAWLEDLAENPPPVSDALRKLYADYQAAGLMSLAAEANWEARALAAEAALAAERERCERAIRDCPSLDENGYICEKAAAIAAIRAQGE